MDRDRAMQPLRGQARLDARAARKQHNGPSGRCVSPFVMGGDLREVSIGQPYGIFFVPFPGTLSRIDLMAKNGTLQAGEKAIWELRLESRSDTQTKILTQDESTKAFLMTKIFLEALVIELTLLRIEQEDTELLDVTPREKSFWASFTFHANPHECRFLGGVDESTS